MDPHQENPDDAEAWDFGDVLPETFAEDPQYPSYDDDNELSTQIAIPDIASWTPPLPLQAPTASDRAESSLDLAGAVDTTPNLHPSGFPPIDFGIDHATPDEASRSTQEVMQENRPEDDVFSLINFDPDRNSVDPVEHQAFPFNAAQDDTLGISGPDANLPATQVVDFNWIAPPNPVETAGCPWTANATPWEFPPGGGRSSSIAPPEADLARAHNPAWVPLFANPEPLSEATMSAIPTGTINPDPAEKTPHASSALLPPTQIAPIVRELRRPTLAQAPPSIYTPILPREPPSSNSLLAGNRQDSSSQSDASLNTALVPHAHASAWRSGNKRTRNTQEDIIPASYLCEIDFSKSAGFGGTGKQLSEPLKRKKRKTGRVGRSCLRCLLHHVKCSETLPCAQCLQLFQGRANKHSNVMVQWVPWTCCIDADLSKLNFFHQSESLLNDMANAFEEKDVSNMVIVERIGGIWQTARYFAQALMLSVENMAVEAGIHHLVGFQACRSALLGRHEQTKLRSPIFWLESLLSRQALPWPNSIIPPHDNRSPSLAWIFAVIVLFPEIFVKVGLSDQAFVELSIKISADFFASTMGLLKEARSSTKRKYWESWKHWPILTEQLMTIQLLTTYASFRNQLSLRFYFLYSAPRVKFWEAQDSEHRRETALAMRDASRRLLAVTDEEGWDHLHKYALHWLDWLQEGSDMHCEIMMKLFHMNTLCRVAAGQRGEEMNARTKRGGPPDHGPENWSQVLKARIFDAVGNLSNQISMDEAVTITEIDASFELGPIPTELLVSSTNELNFTSILLDSLDRAIARRLQRSEFNRSRPCKIIRLPKHPKHKCTDKRTGELAWNLARLLRSAHE